VSKIALNMPLKQRRLLIRLAVVALWISIGVVLFLFNRGHSILMDNRPVVNLNLTAPNMITVIVNKKPPVELSRGEREIVNKLPGSKHKIRVEFSDGKPPFETNIILPIRPDMFILSIPKMINGIEPYFEVFRIQDTQPQETQEQDELDEDE